MLATAQTLICFFSSRTQLLRQWSKRRNKIPTWIIVCVSAIALPISSDEAQILLFRRQTIRTSFKGKTLACHSNSHRKYKRHVAWPFLKNQCLERVLQATPIAKMSLYYATLARNSSSQATNGARSSMMILTSRIRTGKSLTYTRKHAKQTRITISWTMA